MRLEITTQPKQVLAPSTSRIGWEVQYLPSSIVAGNTGLVYLASRVPPSADVTSTVYEEVLNPGASVARTIANGDSTDVVRDAVWLVSDTAGMVVLVKEFIGDEV